MRTAIYVALEGGCGKHTQDVRVQGSDDDYTLRGSALAEPVAQQYHFPRSCLQLLGTTTQPHHLRTSRLAYTMTLSQSTEASDSYSEKLSHPVRFLEERKMKKRRNRTLSDTLLVTDSEKGKPLRPSLAILV
jgi:hypothetical protein